MHFGVLVVTIKLTSRKSAGALGDSFTNLFFLRGGGGGGRGEVGTFGGGGGGGGGGKLSLSPVLVLDSKLHQARARLSHISPGMILVIFCFHS